MIKFLPIFLLTFLLLGLPLATPVSAVSQAALVEFNMQDIDTALKDYQKQLDEIKQQVSKANTIGQLAVLFEATQSLSSGQL